jgi:hypothetical protein
MPVHKAVVTGLIRDHRCSPGSGVTQKAAPTGQAAWAPGLCNQRR